MWKNNVFHMVDIFGVNAFILFQKHRSMNPGVNSLALPKSYALLDFREAIIRQLVNLAEYAEPPLLCSKMFRFLLMKGFKPDILLQQQT